MVDTVQKDDIMKVLDTLDIGSKVVDGLAYLGSAK